jgi:hypothetical protein
MRGRISSMNTDGSSASPPASSQSCSSRLGLLAVDSGATSLQKPGRDAGRRPDALLTLEARPAGHIATRAQPSIARRPSLYIWASFTAAGAGDHRAESDVRSTTSRALRPGVDATYGVHHMGSTDRNLISALHTMSAFRAQEHAPILPAPTTPVGAEGLEHRTSRERVLGSLCS